jgi:hypothetical protein
MLTADGGTKEEGGSEGGFKRGDSSRGRTTRAMPTCFRARRNKYSSAPCETIGRCRSFSLDRKTSEKHKVFFTDVQEREIPTSAASIVVNIMSFASKSYEDTAFAGKDFRQ